MKVLEGMIWSSKVLVNMMKIMLHNVFIAAQ
jgi:hypothetical protein